VKDGDPRNWRLGSSIAASLSANQMGAAFGEADWSRIQPSRSVSILKAWRAALGASEHKGSGHRCTGVYATLVTALLFGSVFAFTWRAAQNTELDHEHCWSCGQRNQHKLWCPNR